MLLILGGKRVNLHMLSFAKTHLLEYKIAAVLYTHSVNWPAKNTHKLGQWWDWLRVGRHRRCGHLVARRRWHRIHWRGWRSGGGNRLWRRVPIEYREWIAPFVVALSRLFGGRRRTLAQFGHQAEILFVDVAGRCRVAVLVRHTAVAGPLVLAVAGNVAGAAARRAHNIVGHVRLIRAEPAFVVV